MEPHTPASFYMHLMIDAVPEKKDHLEALLSKHCITFAVNEQVNELRCRAHLESKVIEVGTKWLSRLGAAALAYWCLYDEVRRAKLNDPSIRELDLQSSSRLRVAVDLLRRAVACDVAIRRDKYTPLGSRPDCLSKLFEIAPEKDKELAEEITLRAAAFMVCHELAHFDCGHDCGSDLVQQEKDADRYAAKWLLDDGVPLPRDERAMRELATAVALGWLTTIEVYAPSKGNTHPPGYDRLYQVMESSVSERNPIWTFLAVLLLFNLQALDLDWGRDIQHRSSKDAVNFYIDIISKRRC